MDTETRKNLGGIVGEFLKIEREQTLASREARNFITGLLHDTEPVQFVPSAYWNNRIAAGDPDAFENALLDESENIVFDRLSEEEPRDGDGYLVSIGWDKDVEDVVAQVYEIEKKKTRAVHLGNIKSIVEILRFIDAFSS